MVLSKLDLFGHLPLSNHLIQMVLSKLDLFGQLLLELLKVARLESRLEGQPQGPPQPSLTDHVASDGPLSDQQSHLVLPQAVVDSTSVVGTDGALHHGHQVVDAVITDLLHETKDTSTEEDLGVAILEFVSDEIDLVHDSVSRSNVLLLLSHWTFHLFHRSHRFFGGKDDIAGPKVVVDDPVGVALPADTDALKHTVAGQLVHDQEGVNLAGFLVVVGHNATDEGRFSRHQHVDQVVQLIPEVGADSLEVGHLCGGLRLHHNPLLTPPVSWWRKILLFLGLAGVIHIDLAHEGTGLSLLQQVNNSVVDGIPVLVQPSSDVVGDSSGIMDNGKVGIFVRLALGLGEVGMLTKMLGFQLGLKGLIRSLGVDGLLFQDGEDPHGLLKELKAGSEIHPEVTGDPDDALSHVLLLFQDKHSVVEELLELLIDKVDTDLLEGVKLENFKSGDVEDTNEGDLLHRRIYESVVAHVYNITEETAVDVLDDGTDADFAGVCVLRLTHPLCPDLVLGIDESVIDALGAVAEVEDGVDLFSTVQRLW